MKPKILSVDDNPANLVAVRRLLSKLEGIDLVEARTGNEALAATLDNEFALILLDVYMPDMDGFEVATLLAQEQRSRHTPIIFVTATYADDLHRMKGYRFGAVDYITKPLDERILVSKVQVFLELYRNRAALRQAMDELSERNRQLEREVAERKRAEDAVMHLATHDALTGLPNRRLFMEKSEKAIQRSQEHGRSFGMVYIDLNKFKDINDQHGHHTGDRVLVVMAQRLKALVDVEDCVSRLGGDEFAVLMHESNEEKLAQLARRLADNLQLPIDIPSLPNQPGRQIHPVVSVGTSMFPDNGDTLDEVMHVADERMYESKRSGGGFRPNP